MPDVPNFVPGPAWPGNYIQPGTANPAPNPAVSVAPNTKSGNPMQLVYPLPKPTDADYLTHLGGTPFPRGVQPGDFGAG